MNYFKFKMFTEILKRVNTLISRYLYTEISGSSKRREYRKDALICRSIKKKVDSRDFSLCTNLSLYL